MSKQPADETLAAERRALFVRIFDAWNRGERDFDELVGKDFVLDSGMTDTKYIGYEGLRTWTAEIDEQFDQWTLHLDELRFLDRDRILGLGGVSLRGRGSGVEFEQPLGWLIRFDQGARPLEMRTFRDHAAALAAAGLDDG